MSPNRQSFHSTPIVSTDRKVSARFALQRFAQVFAANIVKLLILFVGFVLITPGCQSFPKRTSQRSSKCDELCERAREAKERGNQTQANQFIDAAVLQQPNDVETRRQLAETMWTNGRREEAISEYVALCEAQSNDGALAARLAVLQWEFGRKSDASTTAATALELNPHLSDALLVKARYETDRGDLNAALDTYVHLSHLVPQDPTVQFELGELHLKRGQPDRACPLFRSVAHNPSLPLEKQKQAEWRLGMAYAKCGRWSRASSTLEKALDQRTATSEDWSLLGWTRFQSGDINGAQLALQHAIDRNPSSSDARALAQKLDHFIVSENKNSVNTAAFSDPNR